MDFETLLTLGFIVYFLFRALKGSKPQRPPGPRPAEVEADQESQEMDDALREIRIALGMEVPAPPPAPQAPPPVPPAPVAPPVPPAPVASPLRKEPALRRSTPRIPTKAFERGHTPLPPTPLPEVAKEVVPAHVTAAADLRSRLRRPGAAREAMLLHEILGRPRAVRPFLRPPGTGRA